MNQIRQQLIVFWKNLKLTQRLVLIGFVLVSLVLTAVFVVWAYTPTYAVAFSGLSEADAGLIVEKLSEQGISYQLRDNATILVPSNQVYDARLAIARDGLPQGTTVGYEIFSGNTFGMTDFTQRVNYQRALEGELERTIGSMNSVENVRVHIVIPEKTLLSEDEAPTTASVIIQEKLGYQLDAAQIRSITHLIASSVEGMKPEHVAVVDVNGNLLASGMGADQAGGLSDADTRRAAESAASYEIKNKVQALLDTSLGPNNSVVQAYVFLDWTEREIVTQAYDPNPESIRSSQIITENYSTLGAPLGGIPGAETNLPDGLTMEISGTEVTHYERNEQTFNYEITETETHEFLTPGRIDRISLSVLVDNITDTQKLDTLRAVVAAAAGIDAVRGDTLAVETIDFDRSYYENLAADLETGQQWDTYIRIGEAVAVVLLLLAVLWYVQRLLTRLQKSAIQVWTPIMKPVSAIASLPVATNGPQLDDLSNRLASLQALAAEEQAAPKLPERPASVEEVPVENDLVVSQLSPEDERLQRFMERMVADNPTTIAEIIRQWLREEQR